MIVASFCDCTANCFTIDAAFYAAGRGYQVSAADKKPCRKVDHGPISSIPSDLRIQSWSATTSREAITASPTQLVEAMAVAIDQWRESVSLYVAKTVMRTRPPQADSAAPPKIGWVGKR